jgi:hypothetical protein
MSEEKCCGGGCKAFSAEQTEAVKLSAANFGMDPSVIAEILATWGPAVLATVVEALRSGFSVAFVMDMLNKFGPFILKWIVGLFNQKKMLEASGVADVFPPDAKPGEGVSASILVSMLEQIIPIIFKQFGPAILKAIEEAIMNALTNNLQQQAAAAAAAKAAK